MHYKTSFSAHVQRCQDGLNCEVFRAVPVDGPVEVSDWCETLISRLIGRLCDHDDSDRSSLDEVNAAAGGDSTQG